MRSGLDKRVIKANFSGAACTYDTYAGIQREASNGLAEHVLKAACAKKGLSSASSGAEPFLGAYPALHFSGRSLSVLDIGCGTGTLLGMLRRGMPHAMLFGCDMAVPMLVAAKRRGGNLRLCGADFEALPFKDSSFDIAASSLAYQWSADIVSAFKEAHRALRPAGLFAFAAFGPKTLFELKASLKRAAKKNRCGRWPVFVDYEPLSRLIPMLEAEGLSVILSECRPVERAYDNLIELLKTLKMVGALNWTDERPKGLKSGAVLREASRLYSARFPAIGRHGIRATYELVFIVAEKSPSPFPLPIGERIKPAPACSKRGVRGGIGGFTDGFKDKKAY
ncbi:MAG: methyltransferase domain-containing protein [Deltaproteobacteria bacterium]|nr:methyltransferase domain-containing protein [Deltaproteobacteria bacterium]